MKHERILYDIIENEVRRIQGKARFMNTYGIGLLGVEIQGKARFMNTYGIGLLGVETACREVVCMYYNEILETVTFVDANENYVSAILIVNGGTCNTDGTPSANLYNFADKVSEFIVKHFTREFIKYLDKLCSEIRSYGYEVICGYGDIFVIQGINSVCVSVTDILYGKSLGLSYNSLPFVGIASGTISNKFEADVTSFVEKIMKC